MNYVLLFPDELRAESLGCYGHPLVKTPNIDALAAEGTLFENNYTEHPVCGPSRCCLMNGWYPHVDGRRTFYMLSKDDPNLLQTLNDSGMTTCHCGKDDMFDKASMAAMFGEYKTFSEDRSHKLGQADSKHKYSMLYPPISPEDEPAWGDHVYTEQAVDFIHRHSGDTKPFFLMLSWLSPHPPYRAPKRYHEMYDPADIARLDPERPGGLRSLQWLAHKPEFYGLTRRYRQCENETMDLFYKMNAVYLGMISYVDSLVGRVVDALKTEGIYEDTTVILCSDHGDFAGDAGLVEKWPSAMDDMLTRVPLIIRRPGGAAGHRVSAPTQSFDILPTIMDLEQLKAGHMHLGRSLRAELAGGCGDLQRTVYCEGGYDIREPYCFEPNCFAGNRDIRDLMVEGSDYYPKMLQQQERPQSVCRVIMQRYKNWKYVYRTNGENELYDMAADPKEYNNLYGLETYADTAADMQARLLKWLVVTSDVVPLERHR